MEAKETVVVVGITALVTLGVAWVAGGLIQPLSKAGDDEPIVVAGGSMKFVTKSHSFDADPKQKNKLSHNQKSKKVTQVDILYSVNGAPATAAVPLSGQTTIEIDYCTGTCPPDNKDTVTLQTDLKGKGIDIISSDATKDLSGASPSNSNVVDYPPPTGSMSQVRIQGKAYDCPSQGKGYCYLVIHFK